MTREQAKIYTKLSREDLKKICKGFEKHYDVFCAFANGAKIEMSFGDGRWEPNNDPAFHEVREYRVKPSEEQPVGLWKPKEDEFFFYVDISLKVSEGLCNNFTNWGIFESGNCFRTYKEAEAAAERVRAAIKGKTVEPKENPVASIDGKPLTDKEAYIIRQIRLSPANTYTHFIALTENEFDFMLALRHMMNEKKKQ